MVLKSTTLSTFYPSGNSQEEEIASVLFSAYSQQFYLFDFEKGMTESSDRFMYTTETRTKIKSDSSNGGGGGSTSSCSGGGGHGRSGSF